MGRGGRGGVGSELPKFFLDVTCSTAVAENNFTLVFWGLPCVVGVRSMSSLPLPPRLYRASGIFGLGLIRTCPLSLPFCATSLV